MDDRTSLIRVTNHNDKPVVGRYDGREYAFKPEIPLDVPEIVAWHIFDFGKTDKMQCLNRLGWAKNSEEIDSGMQKLNNISFDDPPEMIEAPKSPKKPRKGGDAAQQTGTAGPPVNASGTEGGVMKSPPNGPKIGQEEGADDSF